MEESGSGRGKKRGREGDGGEEEGEAEGGGYVRRPCVNHCMLFSHSQM